MIDKPEFVLGYECVGVSRLTTANLSLNFKITAKSLEEFLLLVRSYGD